MSRDRNAIKSKDIDHLVDPALKVPLNKYINNSCTRQPITSAITRHVHDL